MRTLQVEVPLCHNLQSGMLFLGFINLILNHHLNLCDTSKTSCCSSWEPETQFMFCALPHTLHAFMLCIDLYQFLSLLFIDPFAQQVVGIVRVYVLTFKAHGPYLNSYVTCLSHQENRILRKTYRWNTIYVYQELNFFYLPFPTSLIKHLECYWACVQGCGILFSLMFDTICTCDELLALRGFLSEHETFWSIQEFSYRYQ